MKRIISIVFSCALLLFAAGCKEKEPESIFGEKNSPEWTATEDFNMLVSMTMLVKVDIARTYPKQMAEFKDGIISPDDQLAAFSGEICLGVASPDENGLFFLYVVQDAAEEANEIVLKYYSASLHSIFFSADSYALENDTQLGSFAEPISPIFVIEK